MRKSAFFILAILLFAYSLQSEELLTFQGKLLGYDGKPMKMAQIHFRIPYMETGFQSKTVTAESDGSFKFEILKKSVLDLQFTGTDHIQTRLKFYSVQEDKNINLDVKLCRNNVDPNFKDVSVIGNFNDYDFNSGVPMKKSSDGSYSAEIRKSEDTLKYQILGPFNTPEPHSVNGKQADFFEYDNGGDYRSVIVAKENSIIVRFNPADFPNSPDSRPVFNSGNKGLSEFFSVSDKMKRAQDELNSNARILYEKDKKDEIVKEIQKLTKLFQNEIKKTKNERLKSFLYFTFLESARDYHSFPEGKGKLDYSILNKMMKEIKPDNPIWADNYYSIIPLRSIIDSKETKEYVNSVVNSMKQPQQNYLKNEITSIDLLDHYQDQAYIKSIIKDTSEIYSQILGNAVRAANERNNKPAQVVFYDMLQKDYPKSWSAQMIKREYATVKAIETGKQVPDFSLKSMEDPNITLSPAYFKGKYTLIDIWATWCGPCVGEMGNLHSAFEQFKDKNFTILSISFDDSPEKVKKFREKKWKMPWNHAFTEGQFDSDIGRAFEVVGIPRPVLIDPDGKIIEMEESLRGSSLTKTLEKYLK